MAGRYDGWHHKKGVDQASPEDLAASRKVLGELENQLRLGGIDSGMRRVVLPNGTLIEAAITLGQPSVRIVTPQERERGRRDFAGTFVAWARTAALPAGHDSVHPQQVLRTDDLASQWTTLTYSGSDVARSDGVYIDTFPQGLDRAGNVDWIGEDGERLSWYGPSSRVFVEPYIHPRHQFGKFVFHLGQPLLDVEAYIAESSEDAPFADRYIVGAGLVKLASGLWLYCVQSPGVDGTTSTSIPPEAKGIIDYPLALQPGTGGLHRYRVIEEVTDRGVRRLRVVRNSRQRLANIALGHTDVWFFSQSGHEMVCHQILPTGTGPTPWWVGRQYATDDDAPDPEDEPGPEYLPAASAVRRRIALTSAGTTITDTFSVTSGGAAVPLASEYRGDELRTLDIRLDTNMVPWLAFDGTEVATRQITRTGSTINATARWVLYASPRDGVVVLLSENRIFDEDTQTPAMATAGEGVAIEVYIDGALANRTVLWPPAPTIPSFGLARDFRPGSQLLENLVGQPISPSWFIYGLFQRVEDVFDVPPDEEPTSWTVRNGFFGVSAGLANLVRPSACYFGAYSPIASGTPTPLGNLVSSPFCGSQPDADGNFSTLGCAVDTPADSPPIVLLSVGVTVTGAETTFALATNETLSHLTGMDGASKRYHPLWALGRVRIEQPQE